MHHSACSQERFAPPLNEEMLGAVKYRIVFWAAIGFVVACCWVLYSFVAAPEVFMQMMRDRVIEGIVFITCPIAFAGRYFPLHYWWIPPINGMSYGMIGILIELLRQKSHRALRAI